LLASLGIETLNDLLYAFPRTYEDRRKRAKIADLVAGEAAGFEGRIRSVSRGSGYFPKGRRVPFVVLAEDDTGLVELVFFNAKYQDRILVPGRSFRFFGTPQTGRGRLQIIHPDFERADGAASLSSRAIMPVYSLTSGLTQRDMRAWHEAALPVAAFAEECLPPDIRRRARLCDISCALSNIHYPEDREALSSAKYRLVFEELLTLQTGLLWLRSDRGATGSNEESGIRFSKKTTLAVFEPLLSYALTGAQRRVIGEIYADMESGRPMSRLIQGDVGSGKTAVAMAAVFKAVASGFQAVMMAPTEILAKQHYAELRAVFSAATFVRKGGRTDSPRIDLLTASVKGSERMDILDGLASGETDIAIGTHALLRPGVSFARLGLVVTDEQHRFGVKQRISLSKKGERPDVLVMTATPIPRTLAFILYGDLDISRIDEMPPGRKPILTKAVGDDKRDRVYEFLRGELERGRQAYAVAPLIEERENDETTLCGVRSVESLYDELKQRFPDFNAGVLHGNMKPDEKDRVMAEYSAGRIHVLASTVVIEVGVNVPNATVMVVENAERFGLAQLHQLRGRVGRGDEQSYCVLITSGESREARARAQTLAKTDDGFVIAEKDLSMRGPGEFFGVRQHGIPNLRLADLVRHANVLARVKEEANDLLSEDPALEKPRNAAFRRRIEAMFREVSDIGI
jgi:ATP-dependent DNA helicase RecG